MKKQALAMVVATLALGTLAHAGNNPRIDQALMENLAEKQAITTELHKDEVQSPKAQANSKYRSVEVLEMGDELGGFANSKGLAKERSHKAIEDLE